MASAVQELPFDADSGVDYEKYTVDGLHFNDQGHKFIADLIANFLINRVYFKFRRLCTD